MEDQDNTRTAPFYQIPPRRLVSVEHPAVIKNVDRALDTLEGDRGISKASLYPQTAHQTLTFLPDLKPSQGGYPSLPQVEAGGCHVKTPAVN